MFKVLTPRCLASKYRYKSVDWVKSAWKKGVKGNNRNYTTVDFASTGRTLYSLESVLFWPNISRADAGKYNCLADGQHIGHTRLEVQEVVLPFLNITNMKNQTREPLEGTDLELICGMCGLPKVSPSPSPSPHPQPAVLWFKDGLPVNQTKFLLIENGVRVVGRQSQTNNADDV